MFPAALIGPLVDAAGRVMDRLLPDEAAREKAKAELAMELAKADFEVTKEFHDFVVAYEGQGDKVDPRLQLLRGSVRPILTYALAGLYGWGFLHPGEFPPEAMQGLFQLNLISLGFWYGERALKNLGLNLGDRKRTSDGKGDQ